MWSPCDKYDEVGKKRELQCPLSYFQRHEYINKLHVIWENFFPCTKECTNTYCSTNVLTVEALTS